MILEKIGIPSNKNTKNKLWLLKISMALVASNLFFFLLFSGSSAKGESNQKTIPGSWVEVQLDAQLLTPFQTGKKVLIVQRDAGKKIEGVLQALSTEVPGRITVLVKESEASALFFHTAWEIFPFLRQFQFGKRIKGVTHEIRY